MTDLTLPAARRHMIRVGDAAVHVIDDGWFDIPPQFFPNLGDTDPLNGAPSLRIDANVWLIETGARRLLVDAGSGEALKAMFPETGKASAAASVPELTDIVLTHMHADHLGGLMGASGETRIHVARREWEHWNALGLLEATPAEQRPLVELVRAVAGSVAGRVTLHDGAADLGDGLSLVPLPGHTPGHCGLRIVSAGASALIVADTVISADIHFRRPEVFYALDSDPVQAVATRRTLLADLADSGERLLATHLPFPGVGTVRRTADGFVFAAGAAAP